ncbi:hypothetical protein SDC9_139512 [bioreactor metagenome]|uniref:Uncharacterized protein n=1 Tax=bioreactor metagenome TaxID=1076179 RepID=A0A645DSQ7_9ZZZZ
MLESQVSLFAVLVYQVYVQLDYAPPREARVAALFDERREFAYRSSLAAAGGAGERDVVLLFRGEGDGDAVQRRIIFEYLFDAAAFAVEFPAVFRAERRQFAGPEVHIVSPSSRSDSSVNFSCRAAPSVIQSFAAWRERRSLARFLTGDGGGLSSSEE